MDRTCDCSRPNPKRYVTRRSRGLSYSTIKRIDKVLDTITICVQAYTICKVFKMVKEIYG